MTRFHFALIPLMFALAAAGCAKSDPEHTHAAPQAVTALPAAPTDDEAEIRANRAKLSAEDRALVEAQEWCAIQTDERLGEMDVPFKVMINGKPVFLCCGGCKKKAEADPEKTLAKVEELKAKKKAADKSK